MTLNDGCVTGTLQVAGHVSAWSRSSTELASFGYIFHGRTIPTIKRVPHLIDGVGTCQDIFASRAQMRRETYLIGVWFEADCLLLITHDHPFRPEPLHFCQRTPPSHRVSRGSHGVSRTNHSLVFRVFDARTKKAFGSDFFQRLFASLCSEQTNCAAPWLATSKRQQLAVAHGPTEVDPPPGVFRTRQSISLKRKSLKGDRRGEATS